VPLYERLGLKLLGIEKLRARDRERALTDALS
jgi:hypothetical protein